MKHQHKFWIHTHILLLINTLANIQNTYLNRFTKLIFTSTIHRRKRGLSKQLCMQVSSLLQWHTVDTQAYIQVTRLFLNHRCHKLQVCSVYSVIFRSTLRQPSGGVHHYGHSESAPLWNVSWMSHQGGKILVYPCSGRPWGNHSGSFYSSTRTEEGW